MRRSTPVLLLAGCLALAAAGPARADEPAKDNTAADEKALQAVKLATDGEALLRFFRQRTLGPEEKAKVEQLIRDLGAAAFRVREHATAELIARGPVVVELLRQAMKNTDLETARRAERCIQRIQTKDHPSQIPAAAARLLRQRKPAGAVEVLLAYLPFADNEAVADEVRGTLTALAVRDGKPEKALVAALADRSSLLRGAAAEALAGVEGHKDAVRKLLDDADVTVRLRVALALVQNRDDKAVPVVINLLPELPQGEAWRAEDLLYRLAEGKSPPAVSLGSDDAAKRKCRDAWLAWWKKHASEVDLAKLKERPALLGYTLIVMLDLGKVLELDRADKVRWEINGLTFPLDAQALPGDRLLVAEYHAQRVTERNLKGEILWQRRVNVNGTLVAQRLPNGNTFIATDRQWLEVDRSGNEVTSHTMEGDERIMKASKAPNGEVVCLTTNPRLVRFDSNGKEVRSFPVNLGMRLFGGRVYVQPNGRVLVPHHAENKVIEYDNNGKMVWQVTVEQPIAAVRLPNGNTLVTSMTQNRAVEFDRHGKEVWQYRGNNTRVTRALRR
jgi:PQQ-like domain